MLGVPTVPCKHERHLLPHGQHDPGLNAQMATEAEPGTLRWPRQDDRLASAGSWVTEYSATSAIGFAPSPRLSPPNRSMEERPVTAQGVRKARGNIEVIPAGL